jgi:glutamine cyclotransferase
MLLSGGWYGESKIAIFKYDFNTCMFYETFNTSIGSQFFGEGLTRIGDTVYQLTLHEKRIMTWNLKGKKQFKLQKQMSKTYPQFNKIKEGWGLASQQKADRSHVLWVSDGTDTLKSIDP